ncbi:amino acid permease [Prosthecochloris sp. N3]|uniref:Amino acid permease n=1 Tax=Prosthecochloris ethylica TaxID=2743976 RepID=A0ABR9XTR5_9CHLB|nr:APC family permease [Prosthecochloris ethylica]MBF0587111.1 amino acid permease [Prosthecochloris ethylica]MBF0637413.1 amino acid permease [Prosthecochloris ethylica]MEC9486904.1 APC family permease [Prosthecochloris sp.]NUK48053.1 amino acid permease [Prosthecochloris ethylica]
MRTSTNNSISLAQAVSMAVGTMIGASIFTIFGLGAQIAGRDLPLAFLLSGCLALMVAYSYAMLGRQIVSNAGPISFLLKGIGDTVLTGALAVLMWLSYVVSISLFVKGFAGYLLPLIGLEPSPLRTGVIEAGVIALFTLLNVFGSKAVGRLEFVIVAVKLSVLLVFIVLGAATLDFSRLSPSFTFSGTEGMLTGSIVFFLSYMGFGLITNASENIEKPSVNVPRAIYISIVMVIMIYVSVSAVALGNLSVPELVDAQDNALAVAARPFLGHAGFALLSYGALFSIASALNATLYGGANVAYSLAKDGELPEVFERKIWFKSTEGLYITAGLGLLFALLFNIESIASITSCVYTVIYLCVIIAHYRLVDTYGGSKPLILVFMLVMVAVLGGLFWYQFQTSRVTFYATLVTFGGALLLEYLYRYGRKRTFGIGKKLPGESCSSGTEKRDGSR